MRLPVRAFPDVQFDGDVYNVFMSDGPDQAPSPIPLDYATPDTQTPRPFSQWLKWLLIVLGLVILTVIIFIVYVTYLIDLSGLDH